MSERRIVALELAYDGGDFRGWQIQPGARTVQGVLQDALSSLLGTSVRVHGAARTDAGVHAEAQVAHFGGRGPGAPPVPEGDLDALLRSLAGALPRTLRPRRIARASASFHARASSDGKRYRYRFCWGPGELPRAFHLGGAARPDWERARAALEGLRGLRELPGLSSPSRSARPAPGLQEWALAEGAGEASLTVRAPAFRKHQIRNLAGHLAAVALGLAAPASLAALAQRRRPWMGATAPPHGLCLEAVFYPPALDPFGPLSAGGDLPEAPTPPLR